MWDRVKNKILIIIDIHSITRGKHKYLHVIISERYIIAAFTLFMFSIKYIKFHMKQFS